MTAQAAERSSAGRVFVADGVVHISDIRCAEPDLAALALATADPAEAVLRALTVGAKALTVTQATVDTAIIEKSFAEVLRQMGDIMDTANNRVADTASQLLDHPETGLRARLDTWSRDVTGALDALFDPERATSALARFDTVMADGTEQQLAATRRLLNPEDPDSPVARLFAGVRDQIGTVLDAVSRVAEQVARDSAATAAEARALERSAVKGLAFEEQVFGEVAAISAQWGDIAEPVGTASGSAGGRAGDVTVDHADGRYVVEAKDRKLGLRTTLAELRKALNNREAHAAIAVFSRPEHSPAPGPIAVYGDCAVVVYDKNDPDPAALRLACCWARATGRAPDTAPGVDSAALRAMVDDAARALTRASNVRRALTAAHRKIDEASGQVEDMTAEVRDALERVERAVAG